LTRRLLLTSVLAAGFLLGAASVAAYQGILPWQRVGWTEWQKYSPESRQAWTDGFLAGAAAGEAPDSVFSDSVRFAQWMTGRPATAGSRFLYGSNIYLTRLQDWYYWENHRAAPLWQGVWAVNEGLREGAR
jgi:hypothetical protein